MVRQATANAPAVVGRALVARRIHTLLRASQLPRVVTIIILGRRWTFFLLSRDPAFFSLGLACKSDKTGSSFHATQCDIDRVYTFRTHRPAVY